MNPEHGTILVVDDVEANRDLLARRLQRQGHTVTTAANGLEALELIQRQPFDIILCDIMMPEINGYEVLEQVKTNPTLRHISVIMISALDEMDSVVKCIELGAEDYLFKPFNPVLLKARIRACLEKKRLRDQEQAYLQELRVEREKTEHLLLNILPQAVAEKLKQDQQPIAESFADVSVLFADIVNFTVLASERSPIETVILLNEIFSSFDVLASKHGLEKIKTIGDAYMVVGGVPIPRDDHVEAIAVMALEMQAAIAHFNGRTGETLSLRIGLNTGPAVAGVIGTHKFIYDLWGDTVNLASRMESLGIPGQIQVPEAVYQRLHKTFQFEPRGEIEVKGKGSMMTYLLLHQAS